MAVRSSSMARLALELGAEFENFGAPNWQLINCEFGDDHFDGTKPEVEEAR